MMTFSPKARHLLVTAAILLASMIQLLRGYKPLIVVVGALVFVGVGNLIVYLSGARERAKRRQIKRDYYEGKV